MIALPAGAQADKVKAELEDGVLMISLPVKKLEKKPRPVHVVVRA